MKCLFRKVHLGSEVLHKIKGNQTLHEQQHLGNVHWPAGIWAFVPEQRYIWVFTGTLKRRLVEKFIKAPVVDSNVSPLIKKIK